SGSSSRTGGWATIWRRRRASASSAGGSRPSCGAPVRSKFRRSTSRRIPGADRATVSGMSDYLLGTTDSELERLSFEHAVWAPRTRAPLDRIGVEPGARVLDLGCGPGTVTFELAERVGPRGAVVALDESPRWIEHVEGEIRRRGLSNVRT